jgi:D-psicose/D-tagatose/L-ribulose 3-epimerase
MKCGITTYIWSGDFTTDTFTRLPDLRSWGFDGIELPIFRPEGFPAAAVRRELESRGLACTTSLALIPGLSLVTGDAQVRQRTLRHVIDIIKAAAETGSTRLIGPVYTPVGELPGRRRTTAEWERAVDAYQQLAPVLEAHGVTLGIEPFNRFETSFLTTVADGIALCDAVGHTRVGLLFDTFHANIEEKQVGAALRAAARHLTYVHISENDRGTPGSGHVDWPDVFRAIREIGYDDWLTIEGFGFSLGDLSVAAAIWRDIEPTPDAIARDGVRFVRAQLSR